MAYPLSISASIVALLQLSATVVKYISDVKEASAIGQQLLSEVTSATGTLYLLKDLAQRDQWAEHWPTTIRSLAGPDGPLDQFRKALHSLADKLMPVVGMRKIGKALRWSFEKNEVQEVLSIIERQKTLFMLALQSEHIGLSQELAYSVSGLHTEMGIVSDGIDHLSLQQKRQTDFLEAQETQQLLAWLSPVEFGTQQNEIYGKVQEGTGRWLLEAEEFGKWVTGESSRILWCPGIPGAGKTVLQDKFYISNICLICGIS